MGSIQRAIPYKNKSQPVALDPDTTVCQSDRGTLLVPKKAVLPKICVKTGTTEGLREVKKTLYYYAPWVYILLFLNVIIFAIVASIIRKDGSVKFYVSRPVWEKRNRNLLITWLMILFFLACIFSPIFLENLVRHNEEVTLYLVIGGILGIFVAIIYGVFSTRIVYPSKIDDQNMWLNGVSKNVMDMMVYVTNQPAPETDDMRIDDTPEADYSQN